MSKSNNQPESYTFGGIMHHECFWVYDLDGRVVDKSRGSDTYWYDRTPSKPGVVKRRLVGGWRDPTVWKRHMQPYLYVAVTGSVERRNTGGLPSQHRTEYYTVTNAKWTTHDGISTATTRPEFERLGDPLLRINHTMLNEARVRAILQISDRRGKVLESLAELRQTASGLADNARLIARFVENHDRPRELQRLFNLPKNHPKIRKAKRLIQKARGTAELFANQWLNFWFGLAPVVDEMVFAMDVFGNPEMYQRLRVHGKGTSNLRFTQSAEKTNKGAYLPLPITGEVKVSGTVGVSISAWYTITSDLYRKAQKYGATDVASTAWAVAPSSWLVDWVIPVTSLLEAYEGLAGLKFKSATETRWCRYDNPKVTVSHGMTGRAVIAPSRVFERTVLGSWGMLPSPYIKDPFSLWTATTALSYLTQKLKNVLR